MVLAARPESAPEPSWPDDAIEVGRIVDAWGIKGWIKVQPFATEPQALFSSRRWFVKPPEQPGPQVALSGHGFPDVLRVVAAKRHGDAVVAQVQQVDSRTAAEALRGTRVFVPRSSFPTAEADEYYWVDLLGLDVRNRAGVALGTVAGLIDTGPHSVLRVSPPGDASEAAERLIPFVAAYVDDVSLAERRITVDWGLDY